VTGGIMCSCMRPSMRWLWTQISLECIEILTSSKWRYQLQSLPNWTKKFGELWSAKNDG